MAVNANALTTLAMITMMAADRTRGRNAMRSLGIWSSASGLMTPRAPMRPAITQAHNTRLDNGEAASLSAGGRVSFANAR